MEVLGCLPACPLISEPPEFLAEMWLGRWQLLEQMWHWEIPE